MSVTGGEIIRQFMETYEIAYVFGNPGATETTFLEALSHCKATEYILTLQESSATGIAAGYAAATMKPAIVNVHAFTGLANSICNMYNAYLSDIPLLVIAGQRDRRHLIHNSVLSRHLTGLAEKASKYAYEVSHIDELSTALQRCYIQASIAPAGPTFLSIPMDIFDDTTDYCYFKKTEIYQSAVANDISDLCQVLLKTPKGKLAFIADYGADVSHHIETLSQLANFFTADIYAASLHFQGAVDTLYPRFKGRLPLSSAAIHDILAQYETVVMLGEKVDILLYTGKQAVPPQVKLIHIAPSRHLAFDYPCDIAVQGDIHATLEAVMKQLAFNEHCYVPKDNKVVMKELEGISGDKVKDAFRTTIYNLLKQTEKTVPIIMEATAEDWMIQEMATKLGFNKIHFPKGDGLGWAMPLATGISLATQTHSLCFVGDGGSMYAIHSIWTAAKYQIPVVFVCFINHEYRILKNQWCQLKQTTLEDTIFVGLDLNNPFIELLQIAKAFGAEVYTLSSQTDAEDVLAKAYRHKGPSFIAINCY